MLTLSFCSSQQKYKPDLTLLNIHFEKPSKPVKWPFFTTSLLRHKKRISSSQNEIFHSQSILVCYALQAVEVDGVASLINCVRTETCFGNQFVLFSGRFVAARGLTHYFTHMFKKLPMFLKMSVLVLTI